MPEDNKSLMRSLIEKITAMQIAVTVIGLALIAGLTWFIVDRGKVLADNKAFVDNFVTFLVALGVLAVVLLAVLYLIFSNSDSSDGNESVVSQLIKIIAAITPMQMVATLIGLLTIGGMIWVIYTGAGFFNDATKARGLLTFSVAIVTVAIALILVFFLVLSTGDAKELKERFTFGKDILMVFVGILGTIMGFYYGSDKVSTKDISAIASSVQNSAVTATGDMENKAFGFLLKLDFDAASKAFDDVYAATPTSPNINNIIEIRKLLASKKDDFAKATDDAAKKKILTDILCNISDNKRAAGMAKEIIEGVDNSCKAAKTPSLAPTPVPQG